MNILYLADPTSIHDEKWIKYFSDKETNKTFLMPRAGHPRQPAHRPHSSGACIMEPLLDFSMLRFFRTLWSAMKIKSIVRDQQIDVIHILYAEPNALWCLFRDYLKVPMIITTRGTDVLKTIPEVFEKTRAINYLVAPAYRMAFQKTDWITCTSRNQADAIGSFSGRSEKISIIRTGVDLNQLEKYGELATVLSDTNYILFPRYIKPLYNHEFCLDAIERMSPKNKAAYKMVFLGRDRGDLAYQQKLEEKMSTMHGVQFIFLEQQSQNNLFQLYRMASLVVMTPHSDGSPVSAMEAILCGAKLILGPLNYDEEIFANVAVKLKRWEVNELTEAMERLLGEAPPPVSTAWRQQVDRAYNMSQMEKIYNSVVLEA